MAKLIRMPEIAANGTSAVLNEWLKQEGDAIAVGDVLATIETDKALVDFTADEAGVLGKILSPAGEDVAVGAPIAVLSAPGENGVDIQALLGAAPEPQAAAQAPAITPATGNTAVAPDAERIKASPLARRLAREQGVDIATLQGSGPHGRIVKRDVEGARPAPPAPVPMPPPVAPAASIAAVDYEEIPHSNMRRTIARRLTESKASVPHFYLKVECRMDRLNDLRAQVNASAPRKISVNDFIVKAVAAALLELPAMNVSWTDTALRRYRQADIAVAVATDSGLITPVVRDAGSKSLSRIGSEVAELAERARSGRLAPAEYQGGSFTISNLGMYGIEEFSAIINPPHAAILAVGATSLRPLVEDGALVVAPAMTVTLSADHRAIDGALAAQWLAVFKRIIENPLAILV
ncbi:pyruvate dehydrogenase complex dihydrolipoamide acetyltransferase [Pseudomonas schmalbachii]|uniref:Acetyltransferase component of pyruvate dehydrogenase complex n=1 Tax=Pseudomonas schmalbachii TaxID=2816993 RepID=A0ABS3TK51_9PSED|nr:pyruvate dehydrogenase complex dihydrolipoamide acetyltransferase [Pseudomonas schmalbachii]MBO3274025.1 pyruvate dehydrogenase complex dihydrolipoamide acetyltransferase [Pseudomonas schmalbachii]